MQPSSLHNHGNTCYLNSGLQAIVSIPTMQTLINNDSIYHSLKEKYTADRKIRTRCVLLFWTIGRSILKGEDVELLPTFIRAIWTMYPHLSEYTQQDSVEFVQLVLDMIHEELKEEITKTIEQNDDPTESTSPSQYSSSPTTLEPALIYLQPINEKIPEQKHRSVISDNFGGFLQSEITCTECGGVSKCVDAFFDLSLSIPEEENNSFWYSGMFSILSSIISNIPIVNRLASSPSHSLQTLLGMFFANQKLPDGMDCEKCKERKEGSKVFKVLQLPKVLCFHIKRFSHSRHSLLMLHYTLLHKRNNHISFPVELNTSTGYRLSAVVNHHGGGIGGGHYTSFVRRGDQWWLCDDYSIYKATEDQVLSSEAYLLFYERE